MHQLTDGFIHFCLKSNGAGKTTLLGILTGDITPTCGEADVAGHDVTGTVPGGVSEARKCIGFCPQVDPLIDLMTGRETLTMYGKLRGIPGDRIVSSLVGASVSQLDLVAVSVTHQSCFFGLDTLVRGRE